MPRPQAAEAGPLQQPLLSWLIYSLPKNLLSSSVTLKRQRATEGWIFKKLLTMLQSQGEGGK